MKEKIIIYQLLPRLFGNTFEQVIINGSREENGCGKFNDISTTALRELKAFGITHIWLTGIIRHATLSGYPQYNLPSSHPDIVKGNAGSPYAINDYYDVDPDLAVNVPGRLSELGQLIERIHDTGMKVIIDFIPNHVARDYRSHQLPHGCRDLGENDDQRQFFSASNNFYYFPGERFRIRNLVNRSNEPYSEMPARATGNDVFRPDPDINDWYETVKLNYGIDYLNNATHFYPLPDTWIKMTEILLFWSAKGVDGFRCDMAGMVPVDFWHYSISQVKTEFPDILFIAELYEPSKYRDYLETGFFDYLYDKVDLYDTLRAVIEGRSSTTAISKVWQSLEGQDDAMLRFLENHDEQRIASRHFAHDSWKGLPGMAVAALLNQGPVMIYSGQEVGERAEGISGFSGDDGRTSIFDYTAMPEFQKWYNQGRCDGQFLSETGKSLRTAYSDLLLLSSRYPVFANGRLYDLMYFNGDNPLIHKIFAFLRYGGTGEDAVFLVIVSFDQAVKTVRIKIPEHALKTVGLESKQRIKISAIESGDPTADIRLMSQIITIGIDVKVNQSGYGLVTLS